MGTDVTDVLSRAAGVLAELRGLDLDEVADDSLTEAVLAAQRLRGALEVAEARLISRWDARGVWRPSGAKSAAAWLTWRQHLPIAVARQRVRHARALRTLPAVEQAWGDGDIDRAHVITLLGACNPRAAEAFATDHPELVKLACSSWFTHFKTACDRWALTVDPDGAPNKAPKTTAPPGRSTSPRPSRTCGTAAWSSTPSPVRSSTRPSASSNATSSRATGPKPKPASDATP